MIHIYIASRFSNWPNLLPIRDKIEAMGHVVQSRWLAYAEAGTESSKSPSAMAMEDLEDIRNSELLIIDTTDHGRGPLSGGLYVEMGFALALNKVVWLVGPETNIFTSLLLVNPFTTWEEVIQELEVPGGQL